MSLLGPIDFSRNPWQFVGFRNIFLPNIGEDQTKAYHLST